MKKHFASICMAIVAMLTFCVCTIVACNADSITSKLDKEVMYMEKVVSQKEAELDSLDNIMPLSDTVGETDTFCDMLDELEAFNYSRSIFKKREHFNNYIWLQSLVVSTAREWMEENGTEDRCLLQNKTQDK